MNEKSTASEPPAKIALAGRILQDGAVDMLQCIKTTLRSREVGLTDVEVIHLDSSFFCCGSKRRQLSDRRLWHFKSTY